MLKIASTKMQPCLMLILTVKCLETKPPEINQANIPVFQSFRIAVNLEGHLLFLRMCHRMSLFTVMKALLRSIKVKKMMSEVLLFFQKPLSNCRRCKPESFLLLRVVLCHNYPIAHSSIVEEEFHYLG